MATPESEFPDEPVYQSTGKASWVKRVLFTQVKIPGWLAVLLSVIWSVFTSIPDWKGRIDFWLDAAEAAGGYTGEAASVIGSPYFSIALAATGVLWLAFVGEPKRGVLRDPRWRYLGWGVVAVVTMVYGAQPFSDIRVAAIDTAEAASYGTQFMWAFRKANQTVNGKPPDTLDLGGPLHARLFTTSARGLLIGVETGSRIEQIPEPVRFRNLLKEAGFNAQFMGYEGIKDDQFVLVVGPP
jgi:hypothetical protein